MLISRKPREALKPLHSSGNMSEGRRNFIWILTMLSIGNVHCILDAFTAQFLVEYKIKIWYIANNLNQQRTTENSSSYRIIGLLGHSIIWTLGKSGISLSYKELYNLCHCHNTVKMPSFRRKSFLYNFVPSSLQLIYDLIKRLLQWLSIVSPHILPWILL